MDKEGEKAFTPKPMNSFRSARKLSNYLVRAKMYPIERAVRSKNRGSKRSEVCINVKHLFLPAQSLERPLLLIKSLTVTLDVWSIS